MEGIVPTNEDVNAINILSAFLSRRDVRLEGQLEADVLVLCGNSVLSTAVLAAYLAARLHEAPVIVTGGIGHATSHLYDSIQRSVLAGSITTTGRPEAHVLRDVLINLGVTDGHIIMEDVSTNCGENAELSRRTAEQTGKPLGTVLMLQDPTMQLRSHATFTRAWKDTGATILSYSALVPLVKLSSDQQRLEFDPASFQLKSEGAKSSGKGASLMPLAWSMERFVSLLLGEVVRLRDDAQGYGPKGRGFMDHTDVPGEVLQAHAQLMERYPHLLRA